MQDADAILADCEDLVVQHSLDLHVARNGLVRAMLDDQPVPLLNEREAADLRAGLSPRS